VKLASWRVSKLARGSPLSGQGDMGTRGQGVVKDATQSRPYLVIKGREEAWHQSL